MYKPISVSLLDLFSVYSKLMDMMTPDLQNHHTEVAYIATTLATEAGLTLAAQKQINYASLLHDIGAFTKGERLELLKFDLAQFGRHAEIAYRLLGATKGFGSMAELVRYHHIRWDEGRGREAGQAAVPLGSHIIHLADRISVLIDKSKPILFQVDEICRRVRSEQNRMFNPELVDIFFSIASKEYFWLNLVSDDRTNLFSPQQIMLEDYADIENMLDIAQMLAYGLDFRSEYTASHSIGVAAVAQKLGQLFGVTPEELILLHLAGLFHDFGKLLIPIETINKPVRLTEEEMILIKQHPYFTYTAMNNVAGLEDLKEISSFHHEKLDGTGYPFHLKAEDMSFLVQLMCVSDIFTALAEDRPYRTAMSKDQICLILQEMAAAGKINAAIVQMCIDNFNAIKTYSLCQKELARIDYERMKKLLY
ncbi:MAG: HD domain-containing protein [Peptococcaceae bacterium]|nr:HD domain-containing protein [Peptococcaceae bacterium]